MELNEGFEQGRAGVVLPQYKAKVQDKPTQVSPPPISDPGPVV
jgi:hypothetical protein